MLNCSRRRQATARLTTGGEMHPWTIAGGRQMRPDRQAAVGKTSNHASSMAARYARSEGDTHLPSPAECPRSTSLSSSGRINECVPALWGGGGFQRTSTGTHTNMHETYPSPPRSTDPPSALCSPQRSVFTPPVRELEKRGEKRRGHKGCQKKTADTSISTIMLGIR